MASGRLWRVASLSLLLWPIGLGCGGPPSRGPRLAGFGAASTVAAPAVPPLPPGAVRQQTLEGLGAVFEKDDPVPQELDIELFGEPLKVRFERVDDSVEGSPVLFGRFVDRKGFLTLRRGGRSISGSGWLDSSGSLSISPLSEGLSLVVQGPANFETRCMMTSSAAGSDATQRCAEEPQAAAVPVTVDLVAMYTEQAICSNVRCEVPAARAWAECIIRHDIASWIDVANNSLVDSEIAMQWRLVAVEELPFTETTGNLDHLLQDLQNSSQNPGKALNDLRVTTGADAALVVVDLGTADGMAQPLTLTTAGKGNSDHPIAIVTRVSAATEYMVTHELPHLLGAGHADGEFGICRYSKAWCEDLGGFKARTVMDTSGASLRLLLSSPEPRSHYYEVMGAFDIDNTRTLRIFRTDAADWRSLAPPSPTFVPATCPAYRDEFRPTGTEPAGLH
jgi:hypothetical protein